MIIPPYGSTGGYLGCCVFFFVCTVTDFSAAEKDRGVKFCLRVRLLSAISFSHFGELLLAGSHGGGITSGMYAAGTGTGRQLLAKLDGHSELRAAALLRAVWWDLRLASLLTHLFHVSATVHRTVLK